MTNLAPSPEHSNNPVEGPLYLDTTEVMRQIGEKGYFMHQYGQDVIDRVKTLVEDQQFYDTRVEGWNLTDSIVREPGRAIELWRTLFDNVDHLQPSDMLLNKYEPGSIIGKHIDLEGATKVGDGTPVETGWSVLYTISGGKDILLYTAGFSEDPETVTQRPGMLLVYPIGLITDQEGNILMPGLAHEVPEQEANCITLVTAIKQALPQQEAA